MSDTKRWGGTYRFEPEEISQPGGADLAREAAEARVRRTALKAGHRPVGAVAVKWSDVDPATAESYVTQPYADAEHPWAIAGVDVIVDGNMLVLDPKVVEEQVRRYGG